jgi:histidinol-phosphate aminotransferase
VSKYIKTKHKILEIQPYRPGNSYAEGKKVVNLASNENPLGPSPKAIAAMREAAAMSHLYPDASAVELRKALGAAFHINSEQIICAPGSEANIQLLLQCFCGPGDEVVFSQYGFGMYRLFTLAVGATPVLAPAPGIIPEPQAIVDSITDKTRIVFIDNPGNPVGHMMTRNEISYICENVPDDVIVCLDSAYADYVDSENYTDGRDMVNAHSNVVMIRTFSKFFGLAGARIGWMYGNDEIVDLINRVRAPLGTNNIGQVGAVAALNDTEYTSKVLQNHQEVSSFMSGTLAQQRYHYIPSATNFVLVQFDDGECAHKHLLSDGYLVRPMGPMGLPNWLRITYGTLEQMQEVMKSLASLQSEKLAF